jgi:hypothetical protein
MRFTLNAADGIARDQELLLSGDDVGMQAGIDRAPPHDTLIPGEFKDSRF